MTAKRGRPTLSTQSLDSALEAHYSGLSPVRPRNKFEQTVMRKTPGRKQDPLSPTQQAAQLAVYLFNTEALSISKAAKHAAEQFKVNSDNVRRYAAKVLKGPQVRLAQKKSAWFGTLPPEVAPLLVSVKDIPAPASNATNC